MRSSPWRHRVLPVFTAALLVCLVPATDRAYAQVDGSSPDGGPDGMAEGFQLTLLNGVYEDLDSGLEPVTQGPLTLRFSSPQHRLEVFANRLELSPVGEPGRFRIEAEIEFGGAGQLVAEIEGAGLIQRFQDWVSAPRQRVRATGEVDVQRLPDGYGLTIVSRQDVVRVQVESGFAQQINTLCGTLALMPMFSLDCAPLARALTRLGIPMPPVGQDVFMPFALLTPDERSYLDNLLAR